MKNGDALVNNGIVLRLDSTFYSRDAVAKCLYWYADRFEITIRADKNGEYDVRLEPLPGSKIAEDDLEKLLLKLKKDLIDFNLRDIVTKETKNIRDLLVAKAFSNFDSEDSMPDDGGARE